MKLYINGVQQTATANSGTMYSAATHLAISNVSGGGPFNGTIDDVRFYNRALSASEVTALYNLWVAAGAAGNLETSPNGTTWTSRTSGFGASAINGVAYGGGTWVAVGASGKLYTSPDGTTWSAQTSNFGSTNIDAVAYNGSNLWVASGASGTLATSPDGTTWTSQTSASTAFGTNNINTVAFGNSLWLAGGDNGSAATSPDGVTWTSQTAGVQACTIGTTRPVLSVVYDSTNTVWIAGGGTGSAKVCTGTSNGVTWTTRTSNLTAFPTGIATDGSGHTVAVDNTDEDATTSTPTSTWTLHSPAPFGTNNIVTVAYGNSLWILGAASGGGGGTLASSSDGITWTTRATNANQNFMAVTYGGSLWTAVNSSSGDGDLWTSSDGLTWTEQFFMTGVAYGGGKWVGWGNVGSGGGGSNSGSTLRTSSDGTTWTTQTTAFGTTPITDAAYNGSNLWVAVGNSGALETSADAVTWAVQTSGFSGTNILGVAYNSDLTMWAAVGRTSGGSAKITTTTTPTGTWTSRTSNTSNQQLNAVAADNGHPAPLGGITPCSATATTISTPGATTYTTPANCPSVLIQTYGAGGGSAGGAPGGGLVAWWKLDDGSSGTTPTTAADSSGNGNTGTLTNGPTWTTSGKINNALTLAAASSQYVSVPYASALEPTTAFTVTAWVNPTSTSQMAIIASPDSDGWNNGWRLIVDGAPQLSGNIVTSNTSPRATAINTANPPAGTWTHVALVYNGSTLTVYSNGVPGTPVSVTGTVTYGTSAFLPIGGASGVPYFNGKIDDVRIYNRALSASEVTSLYNYTGSSPGGGGGGGGSVVELHSNGSVLAVGGGGGGGGGINSTDTALGGGGGYGEATVSYSAGTQLDVWVGGGGVAGTTVNGGAGGALAGGAGGSGGAGGGSTFGGGGGGDTTHSGGATTYGGGGGNGQSGTTGGSTTYGGAGGNGDGPGGGCGTSTSGGACSTYSGGGGGGVGTITVTGPAGGAAAKGGPGNGGAQGSNGGNGMVVITPLGNCKTAGSCSTAGAIEYNTAITTYMYCNGTNWIILAQ